MKRAAALVVFGILTAAPSPASAQFVECPPAQIGQSCPNGANGVNEVCIAATCCDYSGGCASAIDAGGSSSGTSGGSAASSSGGSSGTGTPRDCAICQFVGAPYCPASAVGISCPEGGVCEGMGGGGGPATTLDGGTTSVFFSINTCSGMGSSSSGGTSSSSAASSTGAGSGASSDSAGSASSTGSAQGDGGNSAASSASSFDCHCALGSQELGGTAVPFFALGAAALRAARRKSRGQGQSGYGPRRDGVGREDGAVGDRRARRQPRAAP